ncbi:hypothetical protein TorRG33x02_212550 [Trema orientale]|uniref:Uncharacterized protein n=1 Tax=Trema orientale TaxID=63057 RepID=A0A2P5EBP7_TREOI|nr:hypothetical protein TorRG33x02_212550 [Trema orientale]
MDCSWPGDSDNTLSQSSIPRPHVSSSNAAPAPDGVSDAAAAATPVMVVVSVEPVPPPLPPPPPPQPLLPREEDSVEVDLGGLGLLLVSRTEVGSLPT